MLRREDFNRARVDALAAAAAEHGLSILSHDAREATRRRFLEAHPPGRDLWVFGYGSLMWNPAIHFEERGLATVHGFHRRFCLWLTLGRGSPELPGLMLALDRGGSCHGVGFRIAAERVETETEILWMREMLAGTYEARWVSMRSGKRVVPGLAFVVNRRHPRYAGRVSTERAAFHLARAHGWAGTNQDYLLRTAAALRSARVRDRGIESLVREVARHAGAPSSSS